NCSRRSCRARSPPIGLASKRAGKRSNKQRHMCGLPAYQRETQRVPTESVDCKLLRFEKGLLRWPDGCGLWALTERKRKAGDTTRIVSLESKPNQQRGSCAEN